MGPEILSSAGVERKAPKRFPDSRSVLDKFQSARFCCLVSRLEKRVFWKRAPLKKKKGSTVLFVRHWRCWTFLKPLDGGKKSRIRPLSRDSRLLSVKIKGGVVGSK